MKHAIYPTTDGCSNAYAMDLERRRKQKQRETLITSILLTAMTTLFLLYFVQCRNHSVSSASHFSTSQVYVGR